jgi:predicted N-acyltransferase
MRTQIVESLEEIHPAQWNRLIEDNHPFLRHEFLVAMERHRCVGEGTGWLPRFVVCSGENEHLLGAAPMYLKDNSYGEFVFDWGWAEAYRNHGVPYYPKLVSAIPFTPATGQRLLLDADAERPDEVANAIIEQALEYARSLGLSSCHWLFTTAEDNKYLQEKGFLRRLGCQFHWENPGYRDFEDFLDLLTSKKRKNIKRERRLVERAGLELQVRKGSDISAAQWQAFHDFYRSTFHRLGGIPTLTLPFFQEISSVLGDQILLVLALDGSQLVAGAISFRSNTTLYGRHWGCRSNYDSLHFEACYYQGIEYCIRHGLRCFEPGAQGEHKIFRGFLPTLTESAHWIAHPGFRGAIEDFLKRETIAIRGYADHLAEHSPYRQQAHESRTLAGSL